jgi:hypothetical protein
MNILYISSFFIAGIVLYLVMNDLKKCKNILYNKIYYKIWIKTYILLAIIFIHFIWLFSQLFLDEVDKNFIYGLPIYIYIPYLLLIIVQVNEYLEQIKNKEKTIEEKPGPSIKINKFINYVFILYIVCILIFVSIPDNIKKYVIKYVRKFLD